MDFSTFIINYYIYPIPICFFSSLIVSDHPFHLPFLSITLSHSSSCKIPTYFLILHYSSYSHSSTSISINYSSYSPLSRFSSLSLSPFDSTIFYSNLSYSDLLPAYLYYYVNYYAAINSDNQMLLHLYSLYHNYSNLNNF